MNRPASLLWLVRWPAGTRWQPVGFLLLALATGWLLARLPLLPAAALVVLASVVLLTLIQPLVGLALALLAGPFGALESIVLGGALPGGGLLDSGQLLFGLVVAAWLGRGVIRRRIAIPTIGLNLPLALFAGLAAVSLLEAPSLAAGFREMVKWLEVTLAMWLVVDLLSETGPAGRHLKPYALKVALGILLLAGLSQALIGIWQFGLRGDGPEHFLVLGRFYRAYGTFEQPNPYGGYMGLSAALAAGSLVGLALAGWRHWRAGPVRPVASWLLWRLFVAGVTAATGLALLFSWSRGAWLGFAAALAIILLFLPRRRWLGILLLVLALALFIIVSGLDLVPASIADRLASFSQDLRFGDVRGVDINDANYAVLERLAHWQAALAMAADRPWLGVGFGNYEPAYPDYALINWPYALGHAHNYYLNILAEVGALGAAAYVVLWVAIFWQVIRLSGRLDWPRRGLALGLLAAWTALSVHHLVDKLYVNNLYIYMGVMLGLQQLLAWPAASSQDEL
jgi:putative inorganic carbon (hco3(-)) transporter